MIKKNKLKLLLSSLITISPIIFGIILWDTLPEQMTTHWGMDGTADGYSSRFFAVVAMPIMMLIVHWICIIITAFDTKNKNQSKKVSDMVLWICPAISIYASTLIYASAYGLEISTDIISLIFIGLMFVIIGNYLPKCKHNYTIGIKVKWALENEENWNATHRMSGKLWVVGGLLLMGCVFLPNPIIPYALIIILTILAIIPVLYSYMYHKKQVKEGTATKIVLPNSKYYKLFKILTLVFVIVIFIFVGIMLFTGDIEMKYEPTSFTIEADYYNDLVVEYDAIDHIEYRKQDDPGSRTNGFGSLHLLMGTFQNEEFGYYTRYSYVDCNSCVVLEINGRTLIINGKNIDETKEIYDELTERIQ